MIHKLIYLAPRRNAKYLTHFVEIDIQKINAGMLKHLKKCLCLMIFSMEDFTWLLSQLWEEGGGADFNKAERRQGL